MADDAQQEADRNMAGNPLKQRPDLALASFNSAFGMITFGTFMSPSLGGFYGTQASGRNVLAGRSYQGYSGFHPNFRDTLNPGEDQVHHFGAYFSAGIADQRMAADWHRSGDLRLNNQGDVRLPIRPIAWERICGIILVNYPTSGSSLGMPFAMERRFPSESKA